MHLAAFLALVAIIARARPALTRGLQGSPIEDNGAGLGFPALDLAQHFAAIVDDRFETARRKPTLGLLIDGFLRRQVMRQHPPGRTGPHQPAQTIEKLAQIVLALQGVCLHQG